MGLWDIRPAGQKLHKLAGGLQAQLRLRPRPDETIFHEPVYINIVIGWIPPAGRMIVPHIIVLFPVEQIRYTQLDRCPIIAMQLSVLDYVAMPIRREDVVLRAPARCPVLQATLHFRRDLFW